ncbi:hypothetical protein CBER1_05750 [Cercospora berteroae]|uniref:Tyrosinase copper-binding domain-containing protein n=1 Tax=Cercospora berteroae TaxID=357750 RepID=A0A2S6BT41_9PEZI|nr:hypothetical protein CBER1_05750 [Cercospora berteroae]
MRLAGSVVALLPAIGIAAFVPADTSGTDQLACKALDNVRLRTSRQLPSTPASLSLSITNRRLPRTESTKPPADGDTPCTFENAKVRREWDTLTAEEKRAYIDAVLCLMSKPSISGDLVPGARSRYDDFLGTHINQTLSIHGTGNFLSWHRYFTWTYEKALREECGYGGTFPYINWGRYAEDLYNAPIFDGSETSMSGNGDPDSRNNGTWIPNAALPQIQLPGGEGGGCVTSGPFANLTVNLGSLAPALSYIPVNPLPNGLGYNPRCLRRDLGAYAAETWLRDPNTTALIANNHQIGPFQSIFQGNFSEGFLGAHTASHFVVGGDPGGDLFASPGDPYFWIQHSQVDRVWWIWQNYPENSWKYNGIEGDEKDRLYVIGNTTTTNNMPPSRDASLDDRVDLGVNDGFGVGKGADGQGYKIRELVDTMSGPFCYLYE